MKKTVIFLIFADIKRHNFKYIGQFLIKFGLCNAVCFIQKSFSQKKKSSTEKNYSTLFDNSGLDAIKKLDFRFWRKKVLIL